ncbi:hypothetical protein FB451DRAFT_1173587 [Mycena latifolia]|nr:hypothetical protein FB451DRAFT_1173587 [Mycena latifolia]
MSSTQVQSKANHYVGHTGTGGSRQTLLHVASGPARQRLEDKKSVYKLPQANESLYFSLGGHGHSGSKFGSSQFDSNAIDIDAKHIHLSTPPTLAENTVPATKITADEFGTDSEAPKKSCTRHGPGRVTRRAQCAVITSDEEEGHGCADPHCTETGNIEMVECTGPACGSKA